MYSVYIIANESAVPSLIILSGKGATIGFQAEEGDLDASKKHTSKLEGTIASLNEQLKAAQDECKTLKAGTKSAAALERSMLKEQARAEVLCKALASKFYHFARLGQDFWLCGLSIIILRQADPPLHCKGQACVIVKQTF